MGAGRWASESAMNLLAIDHVTMHVRDLDSTRSYYQDVFGFCCTELADRQPRTLQLEASAVHLFIAESPDMDAEFVRSQHVSFEVDSLASVIEQLDARGESYQLGEYRGFDVRNYRWCEWRDPEGVRVECVERTPD